MADATGKIDIGRVLNSIIGVISRNPLVFLGLSFLIVALPQAAIQMAMGTANPVAQQEIITGAFASPTVIITAAGGGLVFMLLSVLLQATLIVATVSDLNGRPMSLGNCIGQALRKLLPLIGLGILFTIGIMLGFMLLIIPGVILYLMWIVAAPVMMAENTGIIDSLKRSAALTKGSKRWILLLIVIFFVIALVLSLIIGSVRLFNPSLTIIIGLIVNTITAALQGTGVAAIYVDLRTVKEGTDSSSLADVFS